MSIRPKPGPVAKNATPRPSGWESNPRPLDYICIYIDILIYIYRERERVINGFINHTTQTL